MTCKVFTSATYSSKILSNLYNLWQSETFFGDGVEILCEGKIFKAHRCVLASSSTYFRAMFTVGMAEKEKQKIELKNMSSSIFSNLLNFIYTGQIILSAVTVQEILSAADMIGLPEVVQSCTNYLKNELHPTNAIGIFRFAESHSCIELSDSALSYIQRHFPEVCELEEFLETPKNLVLKFLESEELKIDSEFQVLAAAIKWLTHDLNYRKPHVFEILHKVRLPLIPSALLQGFSDKLVDSSIQVALKSLQQDLSAKRGYLVLLTAQPRRNAKKHVYVIGGSRKALGSGWKQLSETTLDSVVCLDTFQKTWTTMKPMSIERILPGVTALEGLIYVVGGEQESKILANGEVYNPINDKWTTIEPMVIPRCAFGLTSFENYLYAFGGWVGEDIGGCIERYDPHSNEWTMIGKMEEPKFSMGICSHEGLLYIVGGCTHQTRHLQDLLSYNPLTTEWETLSPMKVPRSQMGIAVIDGHLYAIGGSSRSSEVLKSVEKYSFAEDCWTDVCSMKIGRANPAVGAVDGKIYCIGGDQTVEQNFFRAQVTLATVEVYDPLIGNWEDCENLPESRSEAGYVVI